MTAAGTNNKWATNSKLSIPSNPSPPTEFNSHTLLHHHTSHTYIHTNMARESNHEVAVRVIEKCEVGPPPGSFPSSTTTLPLTFFDIPWFHCLPIQRIFFFHFPHPTHHFLQTPLPILKHSLSLSLQLFFPYASNLIVPPNTHHQHPYIRYLHGDSLSFTVAESPADFNLLVSDSQDATNWYPLVPTLSPPHTEQDGTRVIPLMAIQLTLLPNSGFSISLTFNHIVGDGKSLHHFIKYWASLSKAKGNTLNLPISLPSHEREKVKDPKGLKLIYLRELQDSTNSETFVRDVYSTNKVRATIILSREQIEKLKKCVGYAPHVSTFVVTCSLIWVSMIKSEESKGGDEQKLCYFVFSADCRDHPQLSLPSNYFGNCVASLTAAVKRGELVGKSNGMVVAVNAIGRKVMDFKNDVFTGAESLMSHYREIGKPGQSVVVVAGSPKLGVYETDFGWGKTKKTDSVHLDRLGSISLSDCRDGEGGGGIEVGLALERTTMNNFINMLQQQLDNIVLT